MMLKILTAISYLLIVGLSILLFMLLSGPKSGSEAATRGIGSFMYQLIIAGIVCLLLFNLVSIPWLKYTGLVLGLLSTVTLGIVFLALSGSSLVFQGPSKQDFIFRPAYQDPITTDVFYAFQNGKVEQFKTLLNTHPNQIHEKQLLKDILYDVYYNDKDSDRHLAALKYMLEAGVKIDTSLTSYFISMAYAGKADMTELLLQHGADANWVDENSKKSVLHNSIVGHDTEGKVIEVLIKYGADVNEKFYLEDWADTFTPLSYAVFQEEWRCCNVLLKNGADPNYKNKDGISIKEQILRKAESGERNAQYADLLKLVKQIKAL